MNKVAIVTGASGNLGQAVVKKFILEGYTVIGTVIPNDPIVLNFPANRFEAMVVDLLNEADSTNLVNTVVKKYGSVDVAVLTVGGFAMGTIKNTPGSDILKQYKLNFETTYNVIQPSFVQMIKQNNGRIFIIGSRPGLAAWHSSGMVAYGLAKSLVVRLAELINLEAKGHNVVASVVVPSTIDTPQNRISMPDANFDGWVKPEDIANVIFYHCTAEAASLRETVIKVYNNA